MYIKRTPRNHGFILIEAMIALILISIGLLAVSKLQTLSLSGAGQAKSRSEAMALSQQKLEQVRNMLVKSAFTGTPLVSGNATVSGSNASYAMTWAVSTPSGGLEQRLVQLTTTWTDGQGVQQRLDLNSVVAWDDPGGQGKLTAGLGGSLISPTGSAQRGSGTYTGTSVANADGTKIAVNNGTTYLLSSTNDILLYLPPKNNAAQSFSTITGKVFFDQNASNGIPSSANVRVRLSSEGECVYNNSPTLMTAVTSGSNSYKYFTYTCYVGPGWYGNVGVIIDESVTGNAASPTICVGDPAFNGGASDGTLISANPLESSTRSYRGFKGSVGAYLSTGMGTQSVVDQSANPVVNRPWSGTKYGASFQPDGTAITGPFDGRPRPSAYPSSYASVTAGSATDYFEQNFLVTKVTGNGTCNAKMAGGAFTRNAGKYVCINPDNDSAADVCPPIWPGFESQVGSGGTSYALTVTRTGTGTGTVTSAPAGISCGATCSTTLATGTSVTLTAVADNGSTFTGWSGGACTGTGACTVPMNSATSVTATFALGVTLTVTQSGTGSGTVTSTPVGINCGVTCSFGFNTGTSVTLASVANGGSTFSGWSGGCSGTGPCTLTMTSATTVTATYTATTTYALTVTKAGTGTGTVDSSPAGISSCSSTCSASYGAGTLVTLTPKAAGGSTFTGWSGSCSGTGSCSVTMSAAQSVTATFSPNATCTTPISGSAADKQGNVTASSGTCSMDGNGSSNYSCSLSVPQGTVVTLTNSRTNGQTYTYTKNVTATCAPQTGVNFP
ncbi:InlB B-repeat-containing protein [Cupriavidus lacunae]|uniref:InlB B-repeat-containing protein n=1 Tax=Cupriavidus lacunae TaxID=2666307 RepID=UPI0013750C61|nr:prepilin-type N-terminal cleavage/methylation domain-containing protein [Cupriavidus lacunae]